MSDDELREHPTIINLRAQLRLVTSVLPALIASLPGPQYRGLLAGLESLTEGVHPPSLAQELDELRQIFAEQVRSYREILERGQA